MTARGVRCSSSGRSLACLSLAVTIAAATLVATGRTATATAQPEPFYRVTDLGGFVPFRINDAGVIAGFTAVAGFDHAALWHDGVVTDLAPPGSSNSKIWAITNRGNAAGEAMLPSGLRAVWWRNGVAQVLPSPPDTTYSQAFDLNDAGWVVGVEQPVENGLRAVLWANGVRYLLGGLEGSFASTATAINEFGEIAGRADGGPFPSGNAFVWNRGVVTVLPGGGGVIGFQRINSSGWVVGQAQQAALWRDGSIQYLGVLPGDPFSEADDISDAFEIVGSSHGFTSGGITPSRAIRVCYGVMEELQPLVPANLGLHLDEARAVNLRGQIVVFAHVPSTPENHQLLLTPSNEDDDEGEATATDPDLAADICGPPPGPA